jgi:hypothetical protein
VPPLIQRDPIPRPLEENQNRTLCPVSTTLSQR